MKIVDCKKVLLSFKGEPLKENKEDVTIGMVLSNSLAGPTSNPTLAWVLGKKFATEDKVELKAEDVVFLEKELKGNKFLNSLPQASLLIGQISEYLNE